jgi:predicted LPLAT superfamily acyltransferase
MSQWDGRSRGSPLGYKIFGFTLKFFGLKPAYALLGLVVFHYVLFAGSARRISYQYFRYRIGRKRWEAWRDVFRHFYRLGEALIDRVAVVSGNRHRFSFEFDGEDHLVRMSAEGKGGLIIGAHFGNWNLSAHFLSRIQGPMGVLLYDDEWEKIKKTLTQLENNQLGEGRVVFIPIRNDLSHMVRIREFLSQGGLLAIHGDRFRPGSRTFKVQFLGAEAPVPAGPFILAASLNVPVSFSIAVKEGTLHYHLFATPPQIYYTLSASVKEKALQCMRDFFTWLEPHVRRHPHQWYNFFPFWPEN